MKAAFLFPAFRPDRAPRAVRKTLRLTTPKARPNTGEGVDTYFAQAEYRVDTAFLQNLEFLDRGYDFDEFGDVDNELESLSVVECTDEAALWRFCTGYDVL